MEKKANKYDYILKYRRHTLNSWQWLLIAACGVIFYGEFLADYVVLMQCQRPQLGEKDLANAPSGALRAMILADTHLLGPWRGHWMDKLYREWHMHRAFQSAITIFQPEVVFVLGDLFDEGDMVNNEKFKEYVDRFHKLFHTPRGVPLISAVGNHDVGFHYKMNEYFLERFEHSYNNTAVEMYTMKGVHFVFINSMAMANDGCNFCNNAINQLKKLKSEMECLKRPHSCKDIKVLKERQSYSPPILMQHFPTYRASDEECQEHDSPEITKFRENWEVLSKRSTDLLGELLHPRVAFAGHSHHYCKSINRLSREEYTVASFSWRNKVNPSFLLAIFSRTGYSVKKCDMLQQQTVVNLYISFAVISVLVIMYLMRKKCQRIFRLSYTGYKRLKK